MYAKHMMMTALERGEENGEPVALDWLNKSKHEFVACLYLMSDVLPHLVHLSRFFQAKYFQLSMVQSYLNACITSIKSYKDDTSAADIVET